MDIQDHMKKQFRYPFQNSSVHHSHSSQAVSKYIYLQQTRKRKKLEPVADDIFFLAGKNRQDFVFTQGYHG